MITQDKHTLADGSVKTQVRVMQTYRPYPGASPKRRTVQDFGWLEDQKDPDAFWKEVNACNDSLRSGRGDRISLSLSRMIQPGELLTHNYGVWFGISACQQLGKRSLFGSEVPYDAFRYLVGDRILYQDTLRDAAGRVSCCYGLNSLARVNFPHALGQYGASFLAAQKYLSQSVFSLARMSLVDVVSQEPDRIREADGRRTAQRAFSLSLFVSDSLKPVCLVPVCTDDSLAALAAEVRKEYDMDRVIVVTCLRDPSEAVQAELRSQGDGFLFVTTVLPLHLDEEDTGWQVAHAAEAEGDSGVYLLSSGPGGDPVGVTSEGSAAADALRKIVHQFQRIEASFRDAWPSYDSRTPYVNTQARIRGFFFVHLTALAIVRLIQRCMGEDRISGLRISETLQEARCVSLDWGGCVLMLDMPSSPDRWKDFIRIQTAFSTEYYYVLSKQEKFREFLAGLRLRRR